MNEKKRTAGKWKIDDGQIVTVDDEWSIGYVHGAGDFPCIDPDDHDMAAIIEECQQNGRLIAAAPELLDALQRLLNETEPSGDGLGCCSNEGHCGWHNAFSLVIQIVGNIDWLGTD